MVENSNHENTKNEILSSVKLHYASSSSPLLLAKLGHELNSKGYKSPEFGLLKFIENTLSGELSVVRHPTLTPVIAVSLDAQKTEVLSNLTQLYPVHDAENIEVQIGLGSYRRSLIRAFCIEVGDNDIVYYHSKRPFIYRIFEKEMKPEAGYVEIPKELRTSCIDENDITTASLDKRRELESNILLWAKNIGIEPHVLCKRKQADTARAAHRTTALSRLIEAQNSSVLKQLVIPADIAKILLEFE